MKTTIQNFYKLIGKKIFYLIIFSLLVGLFWFISDYLLVYVFQYFFVSIGAISVDSGVHFLKHSLAPNLNLAILILIIFGFLKTVIQISKAYLSQSLYENLAARLKKKVLRSVALSPFMQSSHETVLLFTERSQMASQFIVQVTNLLFYLIMIAFLFLSCIVMCPKETLIAFPLIVLLILPLRLFNTLIAKYGAGYTYHQKNIFKKIITGLKNLNLLVIYNKTESEFQKGVVDVDSYRDNAISFYKIHGIKTSFPFFVGIIAITITAYFSINVFKTPAHLLAPFFYIFIRACQNLGEASGCFGEITKLKGNFFYMLDWHIKNSEMDIKTRNIPQENQSAFEQQHKNIVIKAQNLSFAYDSSASSEEHVLTNLNFEITTGDILLIKGRSGSGKSTLLKLITGFLTPSAGDILINSTSAQKVKNNLSEIIGYVGPENYFFEGSVKENLLYLNSNADKITDQTILETLSKAHILKEISSLPNGINQNINENVELSTGQKQRLSITQALLRNPRVLILDEATANLDLNSELEILKTLDELHKNIIVIIISHKPTFDEFATKTIQL